MHPVRVHSELVAKERKEYCLCTIFLEAYIQFIRQKINNLILLQISSMFTFLKAVKWYINHYNSPYKQCKSDGIQSVVFFVCTRITNSSEINQLNGPLQQNDWRVEFKLQNIQHLYLYIYSAVSIFIIMHISLHTKRVKSCRFKNNSVHVVKYKSNCFGMRSSVR